MPIMVTKKLQVMMQKKFFRSLDQRSKVLVMQLDILKNDLLTIYKDTTPCCPISLTYITYV